jgi:hypothetical protein
LKHRHEWVDVYPLGQPGFGLSDGGRGDAPGGVPVQVYLDSKPVAARLEKRQMRQLRRGQFR